MSNPKIQVAVPQRLADQIVRRHNLRHDEGPLSRLAISDLWTLQAILDAELRRATWTLDEIGEIAAALIGAIPDAGVPQTVGAAFGAVWDSHDAQDREPLKPLLDKLSSLGPAADMALVDAIAAWWESGDPMTSEAWAEHGVRIVS